MAQRISQALVQHLCFERFMDVRYVIPFFYQLHKKHSESGRGKNATFNGN